MIWIAEQDAFIQDIDAIPGRLVRMSQYNLHLACAVKASDNINEGWRLFAEGFADRERVRRERGYPTN